MSSSKIAVSHPGKMGDALYALPAAKALCEEHEATCDFYTSPYCAPMKKLLEYQWYIDKVIIPKGYETERMDMGVQPWEMPIPEKGYKAIYQLGFRTVPDRPIPDFIAHQVAIDNLPPIEYQYPHHFPVPDGPYIVMAARGETSYKGLFIEVIRSSPVKIVQIGGNGDFVGSPKDSIDMTGFDMLETCSLIAGSEAFVGLMSSQLVLANGFDIPKVAPHDGRSWDMRHVVRGKLNFYPINPTAETILSLALETPHGLIYSKSLNPADYSLFDEDQHVRNVALALRTFRVPHRFEHQHRAWEYGIVLNALRKYNVSTVLDVGGGGSVFSAAAATLQMEVMEIDPGDVGHWIAMQEQALQLDGRLKHVQEDFMQCGDWLFDAVTCISTLEHIENDVDFFRKLLRNSRKIVAITVDFSQDGAVKCDGHLRTYCKEDMLRLIKIAAMYGFAPIDGQWDYDHYGEYVNGYSFASLVLIKS